MKEVAFQVDTRLAKLLSENYRSSEKGLKELVDNAWDADASEVTVLLPEPLSDEQVVIYDNGSGMTEPELLNEYLVIASDRRKRRGDFTKGKKRRVKGRKGIGKFAGLMIAHKMTLETWSRGQKCEFSLSTNALDVVNDLEELPINLIVSECDQDTTGTKITLSDLKQELSFPDPNKFRQLLLQEYGREEDFCINVNDKKVGVDDVQGAYTEYVESLPSVGEIQVKFTVSKQKAGIKKPGISLRVGGKVVGEPRFFGLDEEDDFPPKLLKKIYGEIEADGLLQHVTADWGALVENSELYKELSAHVLPILKSKVRDEYASDINLAQARLKKKINEQLGRLPEFKRQYADSAIRKIFTRFYDEPENKIEPIVVVLLDALERSDYRSVLDCIYAAKHSDIAKLAEALADFGIAELTLIHEQARSRLEFLDKFEQLSLDPATDEAHVHSALENNPWVFGAKYSVFSSNQTLKRQVEECLNKKFSGERKSRRPDLMLSANYADEYLLVEFKRPSHSLRYTDYQQVTHYRNDFTPYTDAAITVMLIGGKRGSDLPKPQHVEGNTEIRIFPEIISAARNQLRWLLKELGH